MYKLGADTMVSFLEIINKFDEEKQSLYRSVYDSLSYDLDIDTIAKGIGKSVDEVKEVASNIKHFFGRVLTKDSNFNIENSFRVMEERGWDSFYVYVDIHGTVLVPDYGGVAKTYYPHAEETLKMLSDRPDVQLILYTCSYTHEIAKYLDFFSDSGIEFDGINKAPVENTRGGDFTDKPYFNVLLEDKAGFVGDKDWYIVDQAFSKHVVQKKED